MHARFSPEPPQGCDLAEVLTHILYSGPAGSHSATAHGAPRKSSGFDVWFEFELGHIACFLRASFSCYEHRMNTGVSLGLL